MADAPAPIVAEIQGLYGPISVPEILIQKLWLRGDFQQEGLKTLQGEPVAVLHPGKWNRLGGPDFLGAELEIAGRRRVGDVEVHFYQKDWWRHGHDANPRFRNVVLHVLVFDPARDEPPARDPGGAPIPTLLLAPYFTEDIEAYALRDAWMALEQRDVLDLVAPLLALPLEQRRDRLRALALERWQQKVRFAQRRLETAGSWSAALHSFTLEVLGLRRNRGPMSGLAERFPLPELEARVRNEGVEAVTEALYRLEDGNWTLSGQRPANHPRARLRQYLSLVAAQPDWPQAVRRWLEAQNWAGAPECSTQTFRRQHRLNPLLAELRQEVMAGAIGGTRFTTLFVDAFCPLIAAELQAQDAWWQPWFHSPCGDLPDALGDYLRLAEVQDRSWPACNGWGQGALERLLTHELQPWQPVTA
ncbi:MAG: hypothetical protein E1N59_1972 [Puniceicoccaceae bacterium 5H]|nr:MAG: hypothetical protein E1N59_1972 [Puniceicoccaceae bacterium 5H]